MKCKPHTVAATIFVLAAILQSGCRSSAILLKQKRIDANKTYTLEDESTISTWVIRSKVDIGPTGKPPVTVILLHPLLKDKSWFFPLGEKLAKEGWDVVLPDLRGHGSTTARGPTWGALEKKDLSFLIDQLVQDGFVTDRVFILGASMGGCVSLLYATYDDRCEGVLAIAPPDGLRGVKEISYPTQSEDFVRRKISDEAFRFGYSPNDASPSYHARTAQVPLIMVRAKMDIVVPSKQVLKIYDEWKGPKVLEEISAGHAGVQIGRDDWYVAQMTRLKKMAEENQANPRFRKR